MTPAGRLTSIREMAESRGGKPIRILLFLYTVIIACPVRVWPLGTGIDDTWVFALNYAAAQGLSVGRDIIFTCGPLGYLLFPMNAGSNLAKALAFQAALWLFISAVLADVFFIQRFRLLNVVLFTALFGLSAPYYWYGLTGTENLVLASALVLLVLYYFGGGRLRLAAALVVVGLLPLFKLTAGLVGFAALCGLSIERVLERRWKALPGVVITLAVPVVITIAACLALMPGAAGLLSYLKGSLEIVRGYSAAMSMNGPAIEVVAALETLAVFCVLLWLHSRKQLSAARFYLLLLAGPLALAFKHGFVRQDFHIINFFCFAAVAFGLLLLTLDLSEPFVQRSAAVSVLVFAILWQDNLARNQLSDILRATLGMRSLGMLQRGFVDPPPPVEVAAGSLPSDLQIESEIHKIVGDAPVASLSVRYTACANLRLRLYPVVQRYAAFTPYLDQQNAAWVREKGPRFLLFDGSSIDNRDAWAETPAMWLEVYRWYITRFLGPRNLLLERRGTRRFTSLERVQGIPGHTTGEIPLPQSREPRFWTITCGLTSAGVIQRMLFRIPEALMVVRDTSGNTRTSRAIPEVISAPVPGIFLPYTPKQFADLFQRDGLPPETVTSIAIELPSAYTRQCAVEILKPVDETQR